MTAYLKDLIHIPEKVHKGDFVLKLSEGVEKADQTLDEYVVTPQLRDCLDDALAFVQSAVQSSSSKMTYLNGSFGSGKSHFMAVLNLILKNHPSARAKADLQEVCARHLWTEKLKFLMIPYHMIGASNLESAILGGYVEHVKKAHPEAPLPAVYLSEGLFADAARARQNMMDERFFEVLNAGGEDDYGLGDYSVGWDAESYEKAEKAPPGNPERDRLIGDLITHHFASYANVAAGNAEAFVSLDRGLSVISRHAKELGYDGIILFLDELILWLASRAANLDFVHQEGQKLAKLVEAQEASRPIPLISFVAKQRDLRELVGEEVTGSEKLSFEDTLRHAGGRFHNINLEDSNLPAIVSQRILKPKNQTAEDQINEAFQTTAKMREEVMKVLLTTRGDQDMFRKVYPFSPALVETLVAVSGALQRNRTALKAMVDLLSRQREELTLGKVIPVGDLFDIVAHGEEVFITEMRNHFNNAKRLYHERFLPLLEEQHGIQEDRDLPLKGDEDADLVQRAERFRNDARLVKTLLLSALVTNVESLKGLTAGRLAALNHGTIRTPLPGQEASLVLKKVKAWASQIGELRVSEGDNPTISLMLVGVDTDRILEYAKDEDRLGNRKTKLRDLVLEVTKIESGDLFLRHRMLWKGTEREFPIEFANVREKTHDSLKATGEGWRLVIDFPFDDKDYGPADDYGRLDDYRKNCDPTKTLVWLPSFFSSRTQAELGRLVQLDFVLGGDRFRDAARHLSAEDMAVAKTLLENQRSALRNSLQRKIEMAYGVARAEGDALNPARSLELNDQFQALWPGFEPRPPVGTSMLGALNDLLGQVLEHDFPAHPNFPVEERITPSHVSTVWTELSRLAQESDARLEVAKNLRSRVRSIAGPLQLGEMAETHFVPSRHWLTEFDKKIHAEKIPEPTVEDLYRWIDQPRTTGLPRHLKDLIVVYFAARTNRHFQANGIAIPATIDKLPSQARLVQQALPSEHDWGVAQEIAKHVFGYTGTGPLSSDYVSRFSEAVRELAQRNARACEELPGALVELCSVVGGPTADNPRISCAREARDLSHLVLGAGGGTALVEALGGFSHVHTLHELGASWRTAAENLAALRKDVRVYGLLKPDTDPDSRTILDTAVEWLSQNEFVAALAPTLKPLNSKAWMAVERLNRVLPPPPPPPPPLAGRTRVASKQHSDLDEKQARKALEEIESLLRKGRRVDLTWTVWEQGD